MKKYVIFALVILILIGVGAFFFYRETNKVRACPDAWVKNEMPMIVEDTPILDKIQNIFNRKKDTEYFVINGINYKRHEVDMKWIEENCDIEQEVVY